MTKEKLVDELRLSMRNKRLLEVVNIGAVEIGDDFIILKQRPFYDFKKEEAIYYNEHHDFNYDFKELIAKTVVYDHSLFNLRGQEIIREIING